MSTDSDTTPAAPAVDPAGSWRPRWWTERPLALDDALLLARRGAWTTDPEGTTSRTAMEAWVWCVTLPIFAVAWAAAWAAPRPGRLLPCLALLVLVATALDTAPVVGALVPDVLTVTGWWAAVTGP